MTPDDARDPWARIGYPIAKRCLDLGGAMLLLIALLPLLVLVAIWIKRDSPGPVLFRQKRTGQHGRPFTIYKFRSMVADADESVHRDYFIGLLKRGEQLGDATMFKVPSDSRVTRAGAFLRKTSVDELPQLFNVVLGEMSLVGPRPPIPYEVEQYEPWMRRRLDVPPGMSGLWQVSGRSRLSVEDMFRLDVEYVERRSLALDLKILLLTIPTVLRPGRAA